MFSYRALGLTIGSFCLTSIVFINAFIQYEQFYPSMVYITKSSLSMAVSIFIDKIYKNIFLFYLILQCIIFLH